MGYGVPKFEFSMHETNISYCFIIIRINVVHNHEKKTKYLPRNKAVNIINLLFFNY